MTGKVALSKTFVTLNELSGKEWPQNALLWGEKKNYLIIYEDPFFKLEIAVI